MIKAEWSPIPYAGSFQHGRQVRSDDPLKAVWRYIERFGTLDSLTKIATQHGHAPALARVAALRVRQSVELWRSARGASPLTRPLLLYYSALNLVRGSLLSAKGDAGKPTHGLRYAAGSKLFDCSATITKGGTFPSLVQAVEPAAVTDGVQFTLQQVLAITPEMTQDYARLFDEPSGVIALTVRAYMDEGHPVSLGPAAGQGLGANDYRNNWQAMFPSLAAVCDFDDQGGQMVCREKLDDEDAIAAFLHRTLWHDLRLRNNPVWFAARRDSALPSLPRLAAYLAGLFILSNVVRYEPEFLEPAIGTPTDIGYVLETFLDNAERFVPQLVIEMLTGGAFFFS